MKISKAQFIKSSSSPDQCPKDPIPEIAFIGRSNVGKSSLINMLTGYKQLAKVSGKPGKTRLINHFLINDSWYLTDLPGYGWARAGKKEKQQWGLATHDYILGRANLTNMFVLVDSRLEPQPIDIEFINWLGEKAIPFSIIFTKADKQSKNKTQAGVARYKKVLKQYWEVLPRGVVTSSATKEGREDVLDYISEILKARIA